MNTIAFCSSGKSEAGGWTQGQYPTMVAPGSGRALGRGKPWSRAAGWGVGASAKGGQGCGFHLSSPSRLSRLRAGPAAPSEPFRGLQSNEEKRCRCPSPFLPKAPPPSSTPAPIKAAALVDGCLRTVQNVPDWVLITSSRSWPRLRLSLP